MKKFPYNENGSTYGYDNQGRRVCTGAKMGRYDTGEKGHEHPCTFILKRVPIDGGGYDGGGAYWGLRPRGISLFCAFYPDRSTVRYIDANGSAQAKAIVLEEFPQATFRD